MRLLNPVAPLIPFKVIYIVFIYTNSNIDRTLIIQVLDIYFLLLSNIHILYIIFSEGSGSCTFEIIDIILI